MGHAPRFYSPSGVAEGVVELQREEARHAAGAMRLRAGDPIELFDGQGNVGEGTFIAVETEAVSVAVARCWQVEALSPRLILGTALPKGKRWNALVARCTELGVDEIQPVLFERSIVEGSGEPEKWQRWAVAAAKQCRRVHLPVLHRPVPLAEFLKHVVEGPCLLAAAGGESLIKWGGQFARAQEVAVVVGPEGGMTAEEETACAQASYAAVSLGVNILRIETACMAACALVRGMA